MQFHQLKGWVNWDPAQVIGETRARPRCPLEIPWQPFIPRNRLRTLSASIQRGFQLYHDEHQAKDSGQQLLDKPECWSLPSGRAAKLVYIKDFTRPSTIYTFDQVFVDAHLKEARKFVTPSRFSGVRLLAKLSIQTQDIALHQVSYRYVHVGDNSAT